MLEFLIGFSVPSLLVLGFIWLISRPGKKKESDVETGVAYGTPEQMLENAREIAEKPLPTMRK